MDSKLLGALGLARKAGVLRLGYDAVCESVRAGEAVLVLLAEDLSPGTQKKVTAACAGKCTLEPLPMTQAELAGIGKKPVGVLAVASPELAGLIMKNITNKRTN